MKWTSASAHCADLWPGGHACAHGTRLGVFLLCPGRCTCTCTYICICMVWRQAVHCAGLRFRWLQDSFLMLGSCSACCQYQAELRDGRLH